MILIVLSSHAILPETGYVHLNSPNILSTVKYRSSLNWPVKVIIRFVLINSDVLSSFRLLYLLCHKLQEFVSTWMDRKVENEYENVSSY